MLYILCAAFILIIILAVKLLLLRKAFDEIKSGLSDCLSEDTNTLITITSRDPYARRLAARLNDDLRLLRKQRLQYQNGDKELKEAVTNISHDLRTPITAIRGYLALLAMEDVRGETRRYLSFIENRIEALVLLLDELFRYSLSVSQADIAEYEDVCLNAALEEAAAAYYAALNAKGIKPIISLPEAKVIRRADKEGLSRVFGNIISNAIKYSDGDLEISLSETGEIYFTNTAAGLDDVLVGKLFNRFYTVNAARNGTGLGLAISRMLVGRMGGELNAVYKDNKLSIRVLFTG